MDKEIKVECICGWKGKESQLVSDFYDSHNMSMPPQIYCPLCGGETTENHIIETEEKMNDEEFKLKCVTLLEGGAKGWGKHILMTNGVTLCGQPTPDAVKHHPILKNANLESLISNYKEEEWDITCDKCLEMFSLFQDRRKNIN